MTNFFTKNIKSVKTLSYIHIFVLSLIFSVANIHGASFSALGELSRTVDKTLAKDVSDDGSIIVGSISDSMGLRGFVWQNGVMKKELGGSTPLPIRASSISGDGSTILGATRHGVFLYGVESGSVTQLKDVNNGLSLTYGHDISHDGEVVVGYGNFNGKVQAMRWEDGKITLADTRPAGGGRSEALGISGDSSVVVGGDWKNGAFLSDNGAIIDLDHPSRSVNPQYALSVSDNGRFAVGRATVLNGNGYEGFIWENGQMTLLGDLPGGRHFSVATDVSNDGIVVGTSFRRQFNEAFYWTKDDGMRLLEDVLANDWGLSNELDGWRLDVVSKITGDGNVIIGWGTNPNGQIQAFRAALDTQNPVPEPSTFALVLLGIVGLLRLSTNNNLY